MKTSTIVFWATVMVAFTLHAATPFTDFEDGTTQGWTPVATVSPTPPGPAGWSITVRSQSGHPFALCANDTAGGGSTLYMRAPMQFTGDLSAYIGLRWDEFIPNNGGNTRNPTFAYLLGADGTTYYNGAPIGALNAWEGRDAAFQTSAWTLGSGTASFDTVLHNVQGLFIYMETADIGPAFESCIDNIALVPEPSTAAMVALGAVALVFSGRLRKSYR